MKDIILLTYYGELYGQLCGEYSFMKLGLDRLCEKLNNFEGIEEFVENMRELEKTGDFYMLNVVLDRLCKRGYGQKIDGHYCLFLTTDKCPDRGFFNREGKCTCSWWGDGDTTLGGNSEKTNTSKYVDTDSIYLS